MKKEKDSNNKNYVSMLIDVSLLLALSSALYEITFIEKLFEEWIKKPIEIIETNIGYYKCGGNNAQPVFCPIIINRKSIK